MTETFRIRMWLAEEAQDRLHAHSPTEGIGEKPETLEEHSALVMRYAQMLMSQNGVEAALQRALSVMRIGGNPLPEDAKRLIVKFFWEAIYLHDLGKINPAYQRRVMRNTWIGNKGTGYKSDHSLLSAILYLHIYLRKLDDLENAPGGALKTNKRKKKLLFSFLRQTLYAFAYAVSRHHSYLDNPEEPNGKQYTVFESRLLELVEQIRHYPEMVEFYRDKEALLEECQAAVNGVSIFSNIIKATNRRQYGCIDTSFVFYTLVKLLYSSLVASDFRATYHFMENKKVDLNYFSEILPLQPVLEAYQRGSIYKGIQEYASNLESSKISGMNRLRAQLFLEADKRLSQGLGEYLFYLEGPTGSGKTNLSIHLALQLLNSGLGLNKLLYIFPFNSLIEQTRNTLNFYFQRDGLENYQVEIINSITPMVRSEELDEESEKENEQRGYDYKSILLNRQLLQYPVTLTSHVNLFTYLFGSGREANLAFAHLCNSVIVLDEIQSYRNTLWKEIIHFLRCFAEVLNIRVIIMSATLPQLDELLEEDRAEQTRDHSYPLVMNREAYFSNPLFRDRIKLHFEWLEGGRGKTSLEELLTKVVDVIRGRQEKGMGNRVLIEFITKKSARKFYKLISQEFRSIPVYELTGDDNAIVRKQLLNRLGKDENGLFRMRDVIVVATQVIEAGVDIDMDVGFKDISILDSEEQFLGRINRSCDRENCHAYFFHLDDASKIYRQDWRTEYDLFQESYQRMLVAKDFRQFYQLSMQRINESRQKDDNRNWFHFEQLVNELDFRKLEQHMNLISEPSVSLYLNCVQILPNGDVINGEEVWRRFLFLTDPCTKMEYSERRGRLSEVRAQMSLFTYTYPVRRKDQKPGIYSYQVGSLFYVEEGAEYMERGGPEGGLKFNREKYTEAERGLFL